MKMGEIRHQTLNEVKLGWLLCKRSPSTKKRNFSQAPCWRFVSHKSWAFADAALRSILRKACRCGRSRAP